MSRPSANSILNFLRDWNTMRKAHFRMLWLLPILCAGPAWGARQIRNIKVAISNPSSTARNSANIVIPIVEIRRVAPDLKPGAAMR